MSSNFELAQLNIAQLKAPIYSPVLADFVANLDRINLLADRSDGFRWRLKTDDGDATALRPFGDDVIVNMTVWRDIAALRKYVYGTPHADIMRRRREWFTLMGEPYAVLWWVPSGHLPSLAEAAERLEQLRRYGPLAGAFTFGKVFPPPTAVDASGSP